MDLTDVSLPNRTHQLTSRIRGTRLRHNVRAAALTESASDLRVPPIMSTTPENEATRAEERSRCWTTNVEENAADESEHQHSGGGFLSGLSGITVTTEISIQPVCSRDTTFTTNSLTGSQHEETTETTTTTTTATTNSETGPGSDDKTTENSH